jgi:hypothetical protein
MREVFLLDAVGVAQAKEYLESKYVPEPNSGCWLWLGSGDRVRYGEACIKQMKVSAHRLAYAVYVGPIPLGLTLDHLCKVRCCVNPAHLEPVTRGENSLRGDGPAARNLAKVLCMRGHSAWRRLANGRRDCETCRQEYRLRVRESYNAYRRAWRNRRRANGMRVT